MKLLGWQTFKSDNCISNIHENCALSFLCQCGCHFLLNIKQQEEKSDE